jgi:hypothetical protein
LELVEDVHALAGSLGKGRATRSVEEMKATARKGIAKAGSAGLAEAKSLRVSPWGKITSREAGVRQTKTITPMVELVPVLNHPESLSISSTSRFVSLRQ